MKIAGFIGIAIIIALLPLCCWATGPEAIDRVGHVMNNESFLKGVGIAYVEGIKGLGTGILCFMLAPGMCVLGLLWAGINPKR